MVRGVHRVTHHVSRRQILFKAAVFHYCEYLQEGCGVSLDGLLWPITQTDPRPVTHGSYATVDVPPPYGHEVDTQVAANTLHHDGTTDAMMDFLLEPMDLAEDTTFLTQLFASKRAITSVAKQRLRWCVKDIPLPQDVDCCRAEAHDTPSHTLPSHHMVVQTKPCHPDASLRVDPIVTPEQVSATDCRVDQPFHASDGDKDSCGLRPTCP